jgi:hypothetical protein
LRQHLAANAVSPDDNSTEYTSTLVGQSAVYIDGAKNARNARTNRVDIE